MNISNSTGQVEASSERQSSKRRATMQACMRNNGSPALFSSAFSLSMGATFLGIRECFSFTSCTCFTVFCQHHVHALVSDSVRVCFRGKARQVVAFMESMNKNNEQAHRENLTCTLADHPSSMYRAVASSSSSLPVPRQSKVVLQRQYREREGECFNALRDVIKELTGEELQKRQEILRKAIDLLLAALELRKQREAQVVRPTSYEKHSSYC
ncbi:hypothetical protein EV363DRAFT_655340 [Boletus edulis]|nr:hypothetical protein EV363DRAFT_655340 [Boletus edulis]